MTTTKLSVKGTDIQRLVISLDIDKMYLSLDKQRMKQLVYKLVRHSNIMTENVNWKEAMIYIFKHVDRQRIKEMGLSRLLLTRKETKKNIRNPTEEDFDWPTFDQEESKANQIQMKGIQGLVATVLVDFIMSNHVYLVGEKIFKQSSGGPIGLDFTQVLAQIAMIFFVEELENLISKDNIELQLHKRYVDNENLIVDILADREEDRLTLEKKTANQLKVMADSIFPGMFVVSVDYPLNKTDAKMPLLDLKVINHNKIIHEFF